MKLKHAAIVVLLFSCTKQQDNISSSTTPTTTLPATTTTHSKLVSYYLRDTTRIGSTTTFSFDTMQIARFRYDAQGRTAAIYLRGNFQYGYLLEFSYQGNSTLPYYYKNTFEDGGGYIEDYLYYDAEGYVKKDSGITADSNGPYVYSTREYSVQGSKLYYTYTSYPQGNPHGTPNPYLRTFDVQYVNGNLTRQTEVVSDPNLSMIYQSTFDNHPNPLYEAWPIRFRSPDYSLSLPPYYLYMQTDFLFFYGGIYKNNHLSQTNTYTNLPSVPTITSTMTYSYAYDSSGYPLTIWQVDPSYPPELRRMYQYKYIYQ